MQNWVKHYQEFCPSNFVSTHPNSSNQDFCLNGSETTEAT